MHPSIIRTLSGTVSNLLSKCKGGRSDLCPGLSTGLLELDQVIGGLRAGELLVIAGRPDMRADALTLGMMRHLAVGESRPVLVFSSGKSREMFTISLLAAEANLCEQQIRSSLERDDLAREEFESLETAGKALEQAPLYVDDTQVLTTEMVVDRTRYSRRAHQIEACFIDSIRYIRPADQNPGALRVPKRLTTYEEDLGEVVWSLRNLARELGIPVVITADLECRADERPDPKPHLSDLLAAEAMESTADTILLLHRPEYYRAEPWNLGEVLILVAKQRSGLQYCVAFELDKECHRITPRSFHDQ